jgi:Flp pilus assembly pilin Flp
MSRILSNLYRDQSGAAALEYCILIALISAVIIGVVRAIGTSVSGILNITF